MKRDFLNCLMNHCGTLNVNLFLVYLVIMHPARSVYSRSVILTKDVLEIDRCPMQGIAHNEVHWFIMRLASRTQRDTAFRD